MHKMKRTSVLLATLLTLSALLAGCTTTGSWLELSDGNDKATSGRPSQPPRVSGTPRYPAIGNNDRVELQAAQYNGDLRIRANSATIIGQGIGRTVIRGRVIIDGNQVTMRNLTIAGNVIINGNSADLTGTRIEGSVQSASKNNRY